MPSRLESKSARCFSSDSRMASSAFRRSVMSVSMPLMPAGSPSSLSTRVECTRHGKVEPSFRLARYSRRAPMERPSIILSIAPATRSRSTGSMTFRALIPAAMSSSV